MLSFYIEMITDFGSRKAQGVHGKKKNKLADPGVHTNFTCSRDAVWKVFLIMFLKEKRKKRKKNAVSRQLKQCQLELVCVYVCQERGSDSGIYLYVFCLQPVRAASKGLRLWKVAWFPACKLINNGYCQGNVWAMCYNEHSETHQHTPTGYYSNLPGATVSPWDSTLPSASLSSSSSYLSLASLYPFHRRLIFTPLHIFSRILSHLKHIFLNLRVRGDSWKFLDRKSEGEKASV